MSTTTREVRDLVAEIRSELHGRLDHMVDRIVAAAREQALDQIVGKINDISVTQTRDGDVPFARNGASRETSPAIVDAIVKMRDEDDYEWDEIVHYLVLKHALTVTGVPWTRDNVIKLYQTAKTRRKEEKQAKAKSKAASEGQKLQGRYIGLLRGADARTKKSAKHVRQKVGVARAIELLEVERAKLDAHRRKTDDRLFGVAMAMTKKGSGEAVGKKVVKSKKRKS